MLRTPRVAPGSLAGTYGRGAGGVLGIGFGVNALIGGFGNATALQLLRLEGSTGLNSAATAPE